MINLKLWAKSFGCGIGGVFLSFLGIGFMFMLNFYFTNSDMYADQLRYSSVDPFILIMYLYFIIPIIMLIVGGVSFYYGIRILSKRR